MQFCAACLQFTGYKVERFIGLLSGPTWDKLVTLCEKQPDQLDIHRGIMKVKNWTVLVDEKIPTAGRDLELYEVFDTAEGLEGLRLYA